jgi:hypothetical protein
MPSVPTSYPLTIFEEYMLRDDCVMHPMTFFLRADLKGPIQPGKFKSAFDEVVRRHPIFWSKITDKGRLGLVWQPDPTRIPSLRVGTSNTVGECPLEGYIDLESQAGVQAFLDVGAATAELWVQFHHSCCDGMAAMELLSELIATYARQTAPSSVPQPTSLGAFPKSVCVYSMLSRWEKIKRLLRDLPRVATFFSRRLVRPTTDRETVATKIDHPAFVEARLALTPTMLAGLKHMHPLPTTINDIVLRDVYLALGDLMQTLRWKKDNRWVRLAVALSHRQPGAASRGCRNNMGLAFLDRRLGKGQCKNRLLQGISHEMTRIKQNRLGYAMLRGLDWLKRVRKGLADVPKFRWSMATVVVSNLGVVLAPLTHHNRVGTDDVSVSGLGFLAPIRSGTPIAFGVLTYADELTISMQYDKRIFDRDSATALLSKVVDYLDDSLTGNQDRSAQRAAA